MIAKFFIERPVLSNVLAILFVLIGLVSLVNLPVAQYPNVVPPTISVTTRYPGASAPDVMNTVALPIEQQVNGVQDMLYMQSTSASDGSYSLVVTFAIGTDLNFAQVLVQNRVASAMAALPQAVQAQGVVVQQKSTSILGIVTLTSPDSRYDGLYLSNYAAINLQQEMARLPGVGSVTVFGAGQYAMRVWLDPALMQARGLTVSDITNALQQQSTQVTAGQRQLEVQLHIGPVEDDVHVLVGALASIVDGGPIAGGRPRISYGVPSGRVAVTVLVVVS